MFQQEKPSTIPVEVEPSFMALGPCHLVTGMNNRVWFYQLDNGKFLDNHFVRLCCETLITYKGYEKLSSGVPTARKNFIPNISVMLYLQLFRQVPFAKKFVSI
jgi:hypothetical protein